MLEYNKWPESMFAIGGNLRVADYSTTQYEPLEDICEAETHEEVGIF